MQKWVINFLIKKKRNSASQLEKQRFSKTTTSVYKTNTENTNKEAESKRSQVSELQTSVDRLAFELKAKDSELAIEIDKRDSEISQLKNQRQNLTDEIKQLFNYKSKYESMRSENFKLLDNEEQYEHQIRELQNEITELNNIKRTKSYEEDGHKDEMQLKLYTYSEKIRTLERRLEEKEQELKDERIDIDQSAKQEIELIREGLER